MDLDPDMSMSPAMEYFSRRRKGPVLSPCKSTLEQVLTHGKQKTFVFMEYAVYQVGW